VPSLVKQDWLGGGLVEGKYAKKFKKIFKKLSNLQTKGGLLS